MAIASDKATAADWEIVPAPSFEQDTNAPVSALSLPISAVSKDVRGRKVRLYGAVVLVSAMGILPCLQGIFRSLTHSVRNRQYDAPSSILILSDESHCSTSAIPTVLVDTRIIPAASIGPPLAVDTREERVPMVPSGKISLQPGMGVCIVGWVDNLDEKVSMMRSARTLQVVGHLTDAMGFATSAHHPHQPSDSRLSFRQPPRLGRLRHPHLQHRALPTEPEHSNLSLAWAGRDMMATTAASKLVSAAHACDAFLWTVRRCVLTPDGSRSLAGVYHQGR
jgi:hypothetical protein